MKVVLVGSCGVGKSSFLKKIETDIFYKNYSSTVGFETHEWWNDWNAKILDFTGKEIFLGGNCLDNLRNACIGIIMYDMSSKSTYRNVEGWKEMLEYENPAGIKIFTVGNKSDKENYVSSADFKISVKNDHNLKDIFSTMLKTEN